MIKFLTNFFIILILISCKELQNNDLSLNIDNNIEKIDKVFKKKKKTSSIDQKKTNNNKIFYYIGDEYYIEGVKYIPEENYNYSEIGLSTYYGKELHNVKTVNNDYNKVTELLGRHKTLPVPSMVKITNLDNGYSVNIKIIDRHTDNSTLIQVSRKVAQLLGFYKDKIATVRVDILSDASKQWKNVTLSLNEPQFDKTISSAPTDIVSITDIDNSNLNSIKKDNITQPVELETEEVQDFDLYLKVFHFKDSDNIQIIIENMNNNYDYTLEKIGSMYNVIIGPVETNEINNLVSYFISKGYKETKILIN